MGRVTERDNWMALVVIGTNFRLIDYAANYVTLRRLAQHYFHIRWYSV